MNEKVYTAWFPQCCAPTLVTRDMNEMAAFAGQHGKIVCKPLHGMGGRSIFVLETGDKNSRVVFENLTQDGSHFAIVQKYLPEIVQGGDARVLLVDGEAGAVRAGAHPQRHRPSRQSCRGRAGRRPAAQ